MYKRRWPLIAASIVAGSAIVLLAMGRPPICPCGRIALWGPVGPTQSQMLADWYSFSHIVHGLLFFALLWLVARRWPVGIRFLVALLVECAWEIVENTPMTIDRYRAATASLGYTGDSVLNSMSDILMMAVGFLAARRLPVWTAVLLAVGCELLPLAVIRDNLTLNVWMLLAPSPAIVAWQAGA
ncbi:DUF2585 family protein [Sphingomonas sp. ASV193]|uniref:DUF2585 family protein n=1 Tax=Sphingomonas sp. ASV193 TaxID=3144405 RepID=UPI0032E87ADA